MKKNYEPCFYVDLGALRTEHAGDADIDGETATEPTATERCAGKTLLLFSPRGFEVIKVPTILN
jgi:hypothetical protein